MKPRNNLPSKFNHEVLLLLHFEKVLKFTFSVIFGDMLFPGDRELSVSE
jgi:hypothetical protein